MILSIREYLRRFIIIRDINKAVYMKCWDCLLFGTPSLLNRTICGNCSSRNISLYYAEKGII